MSSYFAGEMVVRQVVSRRALSECLFAARSSKPAAHSAAKSFEPSWLQTSCFVVQACTRASVRRSGCLVNNNNFNALSLTDLQSWNMQPGSERPWPKGARVAEKRQTFGARRVRGQVSTIPLGHLGHLRKTSLSGGSAPSLAQPLDH
jgi:hypothetical protein